MNFLRRIWTGVVAAVAGVALALLIQIFGQAAFGLRSDYLEMIILACAIIGFLLGMIFGSRSAKASSKLGSSEK